MSGPAPTADQKPLQAIGLQHLAKVPVSVSVRIAEKKFAYDQLMKLTPGGLVSFSKPCEELLDLYVNDVQFARGEAVKIGEKFGLRITALGTSPEQQQRVISAQ